MAPTPKSFVISPLSGDGIFGEITDEIAQAIGVPAGYIHLQHGYPGPKGYGLAHIEENDSRMKMISSAGFANAVDFLAAIAMNYTRICDGRDGRLLLVQKKDRYDLQAVLQCIALAEGTRHYWNIVTAIPKRVVRAPVLFEVDRTGGSEPAPNTALRSRIETLSLPKK